MADDDYRARLERVANGHPDETIKQKARAKLREKYGTEPSSDPTALELRDAPGGGRMPTMGSDVPRAERNRRGPITVDEATESTKIPRPQPLLPGARPGHTVEAAQELDRELAAGPLGAAAGRFNRTAAFGTMGKLQEMTGLDSPEAQAQREADNPRAAQIGTMAGAAAEALGGPTALLGRGVTQAVGQGATGAGRILKSALAGGATASIGQAAETSGDVLTGDMDALEALKRAALAGMAGTVAGAGMQTGAEGARALSTQIRKVPWIGRYAAAKERGAYSDPEMQSLVDGPEGIQQSAERGVTKIVGREQQLADEAGAAYRGATEPKLKQPVDREALVAELRAAQEANLNPDTGAPLRPGVHRALQRAIDETGANPTVGGTLGRRRALKEDAAFDSANPTPEQSSARDAYQALRGGVRKASPEVAAADDEYAKFASGAQRRRDILFNTEDDVMRGAGELKPPSPAEPVDEMLTQPALRVGKEKTAAMTLKRIGDDNEPGLRAKKYLEELSASDPEMAEALEFIAAKKALEATRFSASGLMPQSLTGATEAGGFGPMLKQNARWAGARGLDPASLAAGDTAEAGARMAPRLVPPLLGDSLFGSIDEAAEARAQQLLDRKKTQEKRP